MNQYVNQDIVTYIHNHEYHGKLSAVMEEYKDKIALVCRFHVSAHINYIMDYDLPISTIELKDIGYMSDMDPYIYVLEPVDISILKKDSENIRDGFIEGYPGGNQEYVAINFREYRHRDPIYNLYDNAVAKLPYNYHYTYEKEGWLKEVVDSA